MIRHGRVGIGHLLYEESWSTFFRNGKIFVNPPFLVTKKTLVPVLLVSSHETFCHKIQICQLLRYHQKELSKVPYN